MNRQALKLKRARRADRKRAERKAAGKTWDEVMTERRALRHGHGKQATNG